jgi:hypothetical protein
VHSMGIQKAWSRDSPAMLYRADQLVEQDTLDATLRLLQSLSFDLDSDSVDNLPSFETRWVSAGKYTHSGLESLLRKTVEERIIPFVHSELGDRLCLCEAIIRTYNEVS